MKVSIIIPVYRVEAYLDRCLESVVNQTYKNIEIILVDDGSPDNCPQICDEWAKKDNRIKVIHKENGGVSNARNAGLNLSSGESIFFLDSDDLLALNTIELMVEEMNNYSVDIVSCAFDIVYCDDVAIVNKPNVEFVRGENSLFFLQVITNHACGKLIKNNIAEGIRFPEGKNFEDIATIHYYYSRSKNVSHTSEGLLQYRIHNSSITSHISSSDINDMRLAYEIVRKTYEIDDIHGYYLLTILYSIYSRLMRSNVDRATKRRYKKYIRSEFEKTYNRINTTKYRSVSPMYKRIWLYKMRVSDFVIWAVDLLRKIRKTL